MSYEDIINMPHHVSKKHPQMSMEGRAAQFSPFAALVGFDDEIAETNRQVEQFADLDGNYLDELDEKLRYVREHLYERPTVEITYFVPDELKIGGAYKTVSGNVKRIDEVNRLLVLTQNQSIPLHKIVGLVVVK